MDLAKRECLFYRCSKVPAERKETSKNSGNFVNEKKKFLYILEMDSHRYGSQYVKNAGGPGHHGFTSEENIDEILGQLGPIVNNLGANWSWNVGILKGIYELNVLFVAHEPFRFISQSRIRFFLLPCQWLSRGYKPAFFSRIDRAWRGLWTLPYRNNSAGSKRPEKLLVKAAELRLSVGAKISQSSGRYRRIPWDKDNVINSPARRLSIESDRSIVRCSRPSLNDVHGCDKSLACPEPLLRPFGD